jgi:hypothetical protein
MDPYTLEHDDIALDLKATLAARRELGPDMDDETVALLLARVDQYIESQMSGQLSHGQSQVRARRPARSAPRGISPGLLVLAVFLLGASIAFGAHVHAFPPIAMMILFIVFLTRRGCRPGHSNRTL